VLRAGAVGGRSVTVCGEAASDPMLAPVLVGLGASALSMTARMIPVVRASLARVTTEQCGRMAAEALDADSPEEARHRAEQVVRA